jgi:hypothetical protein
LRLPATALVGAPAIVPAIEPNRSLSPYSSLVDGDTHAVDVPIGVYLRQPWAEVTQMPHSGPLDEFVRKAVRNDYPLLALWTLGIRKLRVPVADLLDAAVRERMATLVSKGFCFTAFSVGVPARPVVEAIVQHAPILEAWELIGISKGLAGVAPAIWSVKERSGMRVYLSRLETSAHTAHGAHGAAQFHHFVRHGFDPLGDVEEIGAWLSSDGAPCPLDGVVFRVGPACAAALGIQAADEAASRLGATAVVHVQLQGSESPAAELRDDVAIAGRVVEAVAAAYATPRAEVLLDTFVDHDRGYFIRHGLVDRRYNPRPAYHAMRRLCSLLAEIEGELELAALFGASTGSPSGRRVFALHRHEALFGLLLLDGEPASVDDRSLSVPYLHGASGRLRRIDLITGDHSPVTWRRVRYQHNRIVLSGRLGGRNPSLLIPDVPRSPIVV